VRIGPDVDRVARHQVGAQLGQRHGVREDVTVDLDDARSGALTPSSVRPVHHRVVGSRDTEIVLVDVTVAVAIRVRCEGSRVIEMHSILGAVAGLGAELQIDDDLLQGIVVACRELVDVPGYGCASDVATVDNGYLSLGQASQEKGANSQRNDHHSTR
jgi:hypothetical protein